GIESALNVWSQKNWRSNLGEIKMTILLLVLLASYLHIIPSFLNYRSQIEFINEIISVQNLLHLDSTSFTLPSEKENGVGGGGKYKALEGLLK
ncbi:unnamed protein product, partial [Allacma fusca]